MCKEFFKNTSVYFNKKCVDFAQKDGKTYIITNKKLYGFNKNFLLFSVPLISNECNKICVLNKIFISSNDKSIYVYSKAGKAEGLITLGEHICDMCAGNDALFAISYHDNVIIRVTDNLTFKKANLKYLPDSILFYKNHVYCLAHDEFYSYLLLFDESLSFIKTLTCFRGIEKFYIKDDKIIFNSIGYSYEIFPNLKIKTIKKHRHKPV